MKHLLLAAAGLTISLNAETPVSTAEHRTSLHVTVYNSNRGLISETRSADLPAGRSTLRFSDIASSVIPQTLMMQSATGLSVVEQNYEYDLISRQKLLEKYVGKEISIIVENEYTGESETKNATLLSVNQEPIFEIDGSIHLTSPGRIILPEIPENLYARPTMNWEIQAPEKGTHTLSTRYLTEDMKWNADYILALDENDEQASLTGWVTLTNNSGSDFEDATLKLVAGDVQTISPEQDMRPRSAMTMESAPSYGGSVEQKEFFDYHLYTYPFPVTVRNNQEKQLSLLSAESIPVQKRYTVTTPRYYSSHRSGEQKLPVAVTIAFETGEDSGIDQPVPAGVLRLYKNDSDGSAVFIGEDRVPHTPVQEEIEVKTGDAFDIRTDFRQLTYRQISNRERESTYEVEVRNRKDEDVDIAVEVPLGGDWELFDAPEHTRLSAGLVQFTLSLDAEETQKLTYGVRTRTTDPQKSP
ncbi:MAG: DUF4139 domain-containing protein [Fibrobacterota bacterium]